MDASSPRSDAERELDELRRRAYGPHPDIQSDPAALVRLAELEAARTASLRAAAGAEVTKPAAAPDSASVSHYTRTTFIDEWPDPATSIAPVAESSTGLMSSAWRRRTATTVRRYSFLATALAVFVAAVITVAWIVRPHPDATLHPIADEADHVVFTMLQVLGSDAPHSSFRGYQPYRGVEPWFSVDGQGFQCFMLIDRSGPFVDGANCVPPGVDLFADIGTLSGDEVMKGLPNGSIVRFHYRGDSVDVFLYRAVEGRMRLGSVGNGNGNGNRKRNDGGSPPSFLCLLRVGGEVLSGNQLRPVRGTGGEPGRAEAKVGQACVKHVGVVAGGGLPGGEERICVGVHRNVFCRTGPAGRDLRGRVRVVAEAGASYGVDVIHHGV
jgi:hypothetical protein